MDEPQGVNVTRLAGRLRAMGASVSHEGGRVAINIPVHARPPRPGASGSLGSNAAGQIKAIIERVERLEEEKKQIGSDIRDVYAEAKGNGFDDKVLRRIVRIRAEDPDKRREHEAVLETYLHALGME